MSTVDSTVPHHGFHCEGDVCYRTLDFMGFPGYRVGDDGSVWCNRPLHGKRKEVQTWRQLRSSRYVKSYRGVRLGHSHKIHIHRLVLLAFVGPCPSGMECCHNDGNPTNNLLCNLRWDTRKANIADSMKHGTRPKGDAHSLAKLTYAIVAAARIEYASGTTSYQKLAKKNGVCLSVMYRAITKKAWTGEFPPQKEP